MNDSPRSQENSSPPSGSPKTSAISPAVVSRAWATHSSARRWRGLGTSARKHSTNFPTTSGAAPNSNGPTSPIACRCERTSTSSDNASGWPCESSSIHACRSSATPTLRSQARASSGPRLRNETTRSRSPQPASRRHASPGPVLPATTTSAHAGSAGTNCSRSQSSSPTAASKVSSSRTTGSPPASAASPGSPRARPSSAMNAGGEGSIARRSRLTAPTPASAAPSASAVSSAVLPTPPGP